MAYCMKCGAALLEGASFCTSCGATVGAAAGKPPQAQPEPPSQPRPQSPPPAQPRPQSQPPAQYQPQPAAGTGLTPNVAGALAYVLGLITGIVFLVIEPYKDDKFVRFHAFQSIFFHVGAIAFWIAWIILSGILGYFLGFLAIVMWGLGMLIGLGILGLWILCMYKAYNNELFRIPFIGDLAAKQAG
jgi:uncharacterized membrane protein